MGQYLGHLLAFVIGCAVGSFLNVIRWRLPRGESFVGGRSKCPSCKARIAWYDNIPVVSYIILGGSCRSCGARISLEYLILELTTGLAFVLIWVSYPPRETAAYCVFASLLIACAGIDYDLQIIPDKLTIPGTALGIAFSLTLLRGPALLNSLTHSLVGMAVGFGTLYAVVVLYRLIRKREGMGEGDAKLMAMVGAFLGYKLALLTIFIASVGGALVGIFISRRSPEGMKAALPFGVFLSPAALICLLWGQDLIDAYIGLLRGQ